MAIYENAPSELTDFVDSNGEPHSFPTEYDPKTGENLTLKKPKEMGLNLTPVKLMQAPNGKSYTIKLDELSEASKMGLKPIEQAEAEKSAQQAHQKVVSGDIGYQPNKTESFWTGAGQGLLANTIPQITGAYEGVSNVVKGKPYGSGFDVGKEVGQSVVANREKGNPITSSLGSAGGSGLTAALTGGVSSIPRMVAAGAGLGATSELENQINKNQPLSTEDIAQQGGLGGAEALAGAAIGKGVQKLGEIAGKAGKGLIPENVRQNFLEGLQGKELASPEVNREVQKSGAIYAKHYNDVLRDIKSEIGSGKGDILHEIGIGSIEKPSEILGKNGERLGESTAETFGKVPVSHEDILGLINKEQHNILNNLDKTAHGHEHDSLQNAYDLLQGSKETLELNPHDAVAMDKEKQILGNLQFDKVKPVNKSKEAMNSIHNVREGIMNYLQSKSEKLGGMNKGYKNFLDAEEADNLHSIQFSPSEIMSLGSDTPSAGAMNKLDNAEQFFSKIKSNPALSPEIKNRMGSLLDDMITVAKRANVAKAAAKGGLANVANQAGYLLSKTPKPIQSFAKTVYGIPESTYNNLPLIIQKSIGLYPDLANKFKRDNINE